jgi:two-component system alkaline phosphatase synthesis response regulator PhoP
VLVIDDEPAIRLLCRVNLEAEGMEVVEAGDGASGLAAAIDRPPDVILLDVMLPGEDGLAVAERIRSEGALRDVPILFLTARADLGDGERIRRAGGSGFLTKPFNPVVLTQSVRELAG